MGRIVLPGSVDLQGGVQYNTIDCKIVEEFGWGRVANARFEGGTSIIKSVVPRSSVGPGRVRVKVLRNPKVITKLSSIHSSRLVDAGLW